MLQPGDSVDIWVVETQLGAGGMGSVYRCHNRDAPRIKAAVKVLDTQASRAPGAHERFVREAELTFQVDHPNVVKVRNIRVDHDPPYLEMEFVEGTPLEDLITSPLPLERALPLMRQAASALAHLHGRGIRHRDIKPANILVDRQDTVKLVDFGLAMDADATRITEANVSFGTVAYAPPEWVDAARLDPTAWDTYALGVVFYEMLTGTLAFPSSGEGSSRQQAMAIILGKQGHAPLDIGPSAPAALRRLIQSMTDGNLLTRLIDAADILSRLEAIEATGGPLPSPPLPSTPPRPAPTLLPEAAQETVVGAGLILGALTIIVLFSAAAGLVVGLAVLLQQQPDRRDLVVQLPEDADLRLADRRPLRGDGEARFLDLPLGTHTLRWARGGDCPPGCLDTSCPPSCATGEELVTLAGGAEPAIHQVQWPEPPEPVVVPEPVAAPEPVVVPEPVAAPAPAVEPVAAAPAPAVTGGRPLVTQRQFARFLAARPEYAPGGPKGSAANYLTGWSGTTPPSPGAPVTDTTPMAAQAYCAWAGSGLAMADDPPTAIGDGMEWRREKTHYVQLMSGTPYKVASGTAMKFVVFRCR